MKSNKKNDKKESATQQLLNLKQFVPLQIGDNGAVAIEGEDGMLYTYIMLRPDNISVLGRSEVLAKIRNLQNILSDVAELQMLCMSSAQNYEDNKRYYRHLAETTESPIKQQLILSLLIEVGISTPPIISAICISTVSSPLPTNRIMNVPPVGIWPILKTPIANLHSQK